jgi:adenosine deaminase
LLSIQQIQSTPKVLLHDHVDGGLRTSTIIELAEGLEIDLPSLEPEELQKKIFKSCSEGSLEKYLKNFDYTIAVMQSYENLVRVARECVVDLAFDGVVYAEVRGAPELFTQQGLSISQVIEATLQGITEGVEESKSAGMAIEAYFISCAMRHTNRSLEVAETTLKYREKGVVGFDIAGAESGFPASNHSAAFQLLHNNMFPYTIHAGEAAPFTSMHDAIINCHANRIGHGVRLIDEIDLSGDTAKLSDNAKMVLDANLHLEMAPTSNLQTGAVSDYASHPAAILHELGFNVALNTDNRLMSNTTLSREYELMANTHGWNLEIINEMNQKARSAAFLKH